MKKIDTELYTKRNADLEEIRDIIYGLQYEEDEHYWIVLYDTSKKNPNYVQATLIDEDFVEDAATFIDERFGIGEDDEIPYMFEARFYNEDGFKHYRGFYPEASAVLEFFKSYLMDEGFSTEALLDVTEEMLEEEFDQ